jgi:hypothetical protein
LLLPTFENESSDKDGIPTKFLYPSMAGLLVIVNNNFHK